MQTALIILAAGMGSRMQSDMPKILHPIGGVPMVAHVLRTGAALEPAHTIVVTGHGAEQVDAEIAKFDEDAVTVHQAEQLGTGHAVDQARELLSVFDGLVLVLYGDTPFLKPETLQDMAAKASTTDVVVLGFEPADPGRYGRLILNGDQLDRIVEFKDASDEERKITLCNGGLLACRASLLFDLISNLSNENASGEYYLTDVVELARAKGHSAGVVTCDEAETLGINSRGDLARAEAIFQAQARAAAMDNGVTLVSPDTVFFAADTHIGRDVLIEPNVVFGPGTTVETGATIRAFSHIEGAHVSSGAVVGPYARLRPGAELSNDARIGNFVEIKNATIGEGAKVNHLSYIGDADVGDRSNIGAGSVTCRWWKSRSNSGSGTHAGGATRPNPGTTRS